MAAASDLHAARLVFESADVLIADSAQDDQLSVAVQACTHRPFRRGLSPVTDRYRGICERLLMKVVVRAGGCK